MEITKIINRQITKIYDLQKSQVLSSVDKIITSYLISRWKTKKRLTTLSEMASKLAVSESSISKYLFKYQLEQFAVLKYIFKINAIAQSPTNIRPNLNLNIQKIANRIKQSSKIIFLAQGNSALLAKQFYTLLVLKDIPVVFVEGRPDQTKLIENYKSDHFLIVFSHSFAHNWCNEILQSSKNCLFITAKEITVKHNQFLFHTYDPNQLKSEKMSFFHLNLINEYMQKIIDLL